MPTYKLTYFNISGLAEPIRVLLNYLGEDFEDFRFELPDWPKFKPDMPFRKVPVLEIDGKIVHQSIAISRYLGKKAKLAGNDDWEALQIDIAVDTLNDLRLVTASYWYDFDGPEKSRKRDLAQSETIPFYLRKLDEQIEDNNGYLANGALSWGDLYFFGISNYLKYMIGWDIYEKYPNLKALRDKVGSIPSIKRWMEIRPKSSKSS